MSEDGRLAERRRRVAAQVAAVWNRYRGEIAAQVEVVRAAADDLARGALRDEERVEAVRLAHKLAGSLGTFGFDEASALAKRVELDLARTDLGNDEIEELQRATDRLAAVLRTDPSAPQ